MTPRRASNLCFADLIRIMSPSQSWTRQAQLALDINSLIESTAERVN